jgi:hypothetical protein
MVMGEVTHQATKLATVRENKEWLSAFTLGLLADRIEVESMQASEASDTPMPTPEPEVKSGKTFEELVFKPVKFEPKTKRATASKPPSLHFTSDVTMSYVKKKDDEATQKEKAKQDRLLKSKQVGPKVKVEPKKGRPTGKTIIKPPTKQHVTRAAKPEQKRVPGRICQICELYDAVDDPDVIDNEQWVQCKKCEAFYHDMCGFALKRCKCGHLMKRPEGAINKESTAGVVTVV